MLQGLWVHSCPKSQHHKDPLGPPWQEVLFIIQVLLETDIVLELHLLCIQMLFVCTFQVNFG